MIQFNRVEKLFIVGIIIMLYVLFISWSSAISCEAPAPSPPDAPSAPAPSAPAPDSPSVDAPNGDAGIDTIDQKKCVDGIFEKCPKSKEPVIDGQRQQMLKQILANILNPTMDSELIPIINDMDKYRKIYRPNWWEEQ